MTEDTGKGAWLWRATLDGEEGDRQELHWDPEATPVPEEEAEERHQRLLHLLFRPRPDTP